jgi:uncharacterized protein YkwD
MTFSIAGVPQSPHRKINPAEFDAAPEKRGTSASAKNSHPRERNYAGKLPGPFNGRRLVYCPATSATRPEKRTAAYLELYVMRAMIFLTVAVLAAAAVAQEAAPAATNPSVNETATAASAASAPASKPSQARPLHQHPALFMMLQKSNAIRRQQGLAPHKMNPILCLAAQDHARYMARTGEFGHYVNDGPQLRARKYGFKSGVWEILAFNGNDLNYAFTQWIESPAHYAVMLEEGTTDAGFGYAVGRNGRGYWVGVYGTSSGEELCQSEENLAAMFAAEKAASDRDVQPASATQTSDAMPTTEVVPGTAGSAVTAAP